MRKDAGESGSTGRRAFLAAAGVTGASALAGCTGLFNLRQRAFRAPPLVKDRPNAVYYPTHVEKMRMVGIKHENGYSCALTYKYPERFWLITGTHTSKVQIKPNDSMHVMPVVWDTATGQLLPDAQPTVEMQLNGKQVVSDSPWPMLAQPMGWHFGDNVQLPSRKQNTYDVRVQVSPPSMKRTGSLADPSSPPTFSFSMPFSRTSLEQISWHKLPQKKGKRGAVPHMNMKKIPATAVPTKGDLPGTVVGTGSSGDAVFVLSVLDDATRFGGSESQSYLVVSPRSPYDRYMLPMMSLSFTQQRGGSTVTKGALTETLDPKVDHHYGAVVDGVQSGDTLTVHVQTPPQFARHEGYETAWIQMPDVTVTV